MITKNKWQLHALAGALICLGLLNVLNVNDSLRAYEILIVSGVLGLIIGYGFDFVIQPRFSGTNSENWLMKIFYKLGIFAKTHRTVPSWGDVFATATGFLIGGLIYGL